MRASRIRAEELFDNEQIERARRYHLVHYLAFVGNALSPSRSSPGSPSAGSETSST